MSTAKSKYTLNFGANQSGAGLQSPYTAPTTKTSTPFKASQAWQDYGATKKLSDDGQVLMNKPAVTPSNTAATNTGGTTLSPAGQSYANQLSGAQESMKNIQTAFSGYKAEQDKGKSTYVDNLKAEQFPSTFQAEKDARDKAAQRLADIQSQREKMEVEARRSYDERLDKSGGTRAAAQQGAQLDRRRSNTELADVALQENAALRGAQVAQGIFESAQGMDRQLTLEEIQILNDNGANLEFGSTISQAQQNGVIPTTAGGSTIFDEGQQASIVSYADLLSSGSYKPSDVPEEYRDAVAQFMAQTAIEGGGQSEYTKERSTRIISSVDELMGKVSNMTTGWASLWSGVPTTESNNFASELKTLKANIGFNEITQMREASKTGGALGQVSNIEIELLTNSLAGLDTRQSAEDFRKNLAKVKTSVERWGQAVEQYGGGEGSEGGGDGPYEF